MNANLRQFLPRPLSVCLCVTHLCLFSGGGAGSDARQDSASGYYSPGGPGRPESAASSSPPASGAGSSSVLVPQPISGAKVFPGHGLGPPPGPAHPGHPGGQPGIRKYQCKMCPQVRERREGHQPGIIGPSQTYFTFHSQMTSIILGVS